MNPPSTKMKTIQDLKDNLTPSQYEAAAELINFIQGTDKTFLLKGYAGTGKTHTIASVISYLHPQVEFIVAAVAHAAVNVLSNKLKQNYGLSIESITLAKLVGQIPDYSNPEYTPENPKYTYSDKPPYKKHKGVIIVDECSMIDDKALKILINDSNCKIIFTGDFKQLPPVSANSASIAHQYSLMKSAELTEIVRTNKEDIASVSMMLRNEDYTKIFKIKDSDNIKVVYYSNYDYSADCVLTYTNESVSSWNSKSYKHHYNMSTTPLRKNVNIILYKNLSFGHNSEVLTVLNISPNPSIPPALSSLEGTTLEKLLVRSLLSHKVTFTNKKVSYILNAEGMINFKKLIKYYRKLKKWKELDAICSLFLISEDIVEGVKQKKILITKNFDMAYAMTVHKSQGSTFKTVAIDLGNIGEKASTSIIKELLYTAVTRASEKVILLKKDPIKY